MRPRELVGDLLQLAGGNIDKLQEIPQDVQKQGKKIVSAPVPHHVSGAAIAILDNSKEAFGINAIQKKKHINMVCLSLWLFFCRIWELRNDFVIQDGLRICLNTKFDWLLIDTVYRKKEEGNII